MKTTLKTILASAAIALSVTPALSSAADFAYTENDGGGKIMLTDRACPDKSHPNAYAAYSYVSSGKTIFGCWAFSEEKFMILWNSGDFYTYPAERFTLVNQPAKKGSGTGM